ncbi:hypothetical protein COU80_05150 [Candidatus Peregrinibacteria bacterium CG10_big_fil_rev_8_21_14_0_10_55_24]|nr:MAG: hypothetical protein COU80_05150 [Candidatus Peregrinibacteria bacterium CG10_big_fil_rev_8_21_14_0_10_55_24]
MQELRSLIGQHFAFAHGRMGVLRHMLLTQADVDRLLGAHSLKETENILTELKLTDIIDQGISDGHSMLEAIGAWMRREVEVMSHPIHRVIFHILWLQEDAPLLALLLKQHHNLTRERTEEPTIGISAYDPVALQTLVHKGVSGTLPSHLVAFVEQVKAFDQPSPRTVDTAIANYIANLQLRLARASGSFAIRRFVTHQIDLMNIRTALRLRDEDRKASLPYLLAGGTVSRTGLAGNEKEIATAIARSPMGFSLPADSSETFADPIAFEQAAAHIMAADISAMWNVPLSIEPLFAFAAMTLSHLRLVRTILIAKANAIGPQEIKRMLPPFISATRFL